MKYKQIAHKEVLIVKYFRLNVLILQVAKIWNASDEYSIINVKEYGATSTRNGIL